jgi:hypothetical protein
VVNVWVLSVAVRVQEPSEVIVSALKVATPATAATEVVPPSVHVEVIATTSAAFVPVVATLPYGSVMETLKGASTAEATTVAGGWVVNRTFVAVPAVTVVPALVPVAKDLEVSVAVSVHGLVPPSMIRPLIVATPAAAVPVVVPASVQAEVMLMTSVAAAPPPEITLP